MPVLSTHPLYILYTSGTTGAPKGIVRDTCCTVVALNFWMGNVFNVRKGSVHFAGSDVGWVVAVSVVKKDDYDGEWIRKYDTSSINSFALVGERCDPDTIWWLHRHFPHVIINDTWW